MRILLTCVTRFPHRIGVSVYMTHLRRALATLGHPVDILALHPDRTRFYLPRATWPMTHLDDASDVLRTTVGDGVAETMTPPRDPTQEPTTMRDRVPDTMTTTRDGTEEMWPTPRDPTGDTWSAMRTGGLHARGAPSFPLPWPARRRLGDRATHRMEYALALAEALTRLSGEYDVVHAMDPYATLAARQAHVAPVVQTLHALMGLRLEVSPRAGAKEKDAWKYRTIEKVALHAADVTLIPSRWLYERMAALLPPALRTRLRHVPLGLDIASFQAHLDATMPALRRRDEVVLFYPARLSREKGQQYLILAVKILKRRGMPVRLWLAGSGADLPKLRRMARRLGLSGQVRFLGQQADIAPWLKACDLVVVPTLHDNQPFAVIEAQLAGKPVIASRVGGVPEMIVDGERGLLVEPRSAQALADAIIRMAKERERAAAMAANAKEWAQRTWDQQRWLAETVAAYHAIQ